jgi:phospholipase C
MARKRTWVTLLAAAGIVTALAATAQSAHSNASHGRASRGNTATPIKHLVIIFQENVSFDHYFGTYPNAANTDGEPFKGAGGAKINGLYNTPGVNGQGTLLTNNPNKDAQGNQVNPRRLDPTNINDELLCDQEHDQNHEQKAFDGGRCMP